MYMVYVDLTPAKGGVPILCRNIRITKEYTVLIDIVEPIRELVNDYFSHIARLNRTYMDTSTPLRTNTEVAISTEEKTILFKRLRIKNERVIAIFEVYGGFQIVSTRQVGVPAIGKEDWYKDTFVGTPDVIVRGNELYKEGVDIDREGIINNINEAERLQRERRRREEEQEQGEA